MHECTRQKIGLQEEVVNTQTQRGRQPTPALSVLAAMFGGFLCVEGVHTVQQE